MSDQPPDSLPVIRLKKTRSPGFAARVWRDSRVAKLEPLHERDPATIGPYQVVAHLGSGGMGRVYLAQDAGAIVAIKMLSAGAARSPEMRTRFEREVSALKQIQSPFVAAIVDSDVLADEVWFAVEFVNGTGLDELSDSDGLLSAGQWAETLIGSLLALASVHDWDIIHRDIKPGNILLSARGPQLIDFGIGQSPNETSVTRTGVFAGRPAWLSPDVFLDDEITHKADIFSLASTMVFALTGQSPWGATSTRVPQIIKRLNEDPPSLEQVPSVYKSLLTRMLDKDPTTRPDARECLGEAWELTPEASRERVRWWIRLARTEGRDIPDDTKATLQLDEAEVSERLILQAKETATSIRQEATVEAQQDAYAIVTAAQKQAEQIRQEAEKLAQERHEEAEKALQRARDKAEALSARAERATRKPPRRVEPRQQPITTPSTQPRSSKARLSGPSIAIGAATATVLVGALGFLWNGLGLTNATQSDSVASAPTPAVGEQDSSNSSDSQSSLPRRLPAAVFPENATTVDVGTPIRIGLDPKNEAIGTVEPVRARLVAIGGEPLQSSCNDAFSLPNNSETKSFETSCVFETENIYRLEVRWAVGGTSSAGVWTIQYKSLITSFKVNGQIGPDGND